MSRVTAAIGSILFFFLAPGTVAGLVPWWITRWSLASTSPSLAVIGGLVAAAGLAALIACFARFVLDGGGTPAPVAPTRTLVITGLYRHVRNPMYVAVTAIIFGQALIFASLALIAYGAVVWLAKISAWPKMIAVTATYIGLRTCR